MSKDQRVVCITSVGTATSVGLILNFRKYDKEMTIIGTDINEPGYTAGSLLVDRFYQVPMATEDSYYSAITEILVNEDVDYLIPVNDTEIRAITCCAPDIYRYVNVIIPDIGTIDLVQDKLRASESVSQIGINVPPRIDCDTQKKCIIRDIHGVGSKGIQICDSIQFDEIDKDRQFVQEFIEGDEYTVDVLSDLSGNPLYIIPRLRMEVKSGVCTKAFISEDEGLINDTAAILSKIRIPGFSNVQFIKDKTGRNWFIEINPRFGGFSNASMLAAPDMFLTFLNLLEHNDRLDKCDTDYTKRFWNKQDEHISWGAVVTRFYTDMIYER